MKATIFLPDNVMVATSEGPKTKKQYTEAYYDTMYNYIKSKKINNGMIMARPYCDQHGTMCWYAPATVNTAGMVGDQYIHWDGLKHAISNVFISANAGYAVIGFDIGGYFNDTPKWTLFLRWAGVRFTCSIHGKRRTKK